MTPRAGRLEVAGWAFAAAVGVLVLGSSSLVILAVAVWLYDAAKERRADGYVSPGWLEERRLSDLRRAGL